MDIKELLFELGNTLGLGNISLNDEKSAGLVFDETLNVNIQYIELNNQVCLTSEFASLDSTTPAHFYESLLALHTKSFPPSANHFGIVSEPRRVVFQTCIELDSLDISRFVKFLESFVNELEDALTMYDEGRFSENHGEANNPDVHGSNVSLRTHAMKL